MFSTTVNSQMKIKNLTKKCWRISSIKGLERTFKNEKCDSFKSQEGYRFFKDGTMYKPMIHHYFKKNFRVYRKWDFNYIDSTLVLQSMKEKKHVRSWKVIYINSENLKIRKFKKL